MRLVHGEHLSHGVLKETSAGPGRDEKRSKIEIRRATTGYLARIGAFYDVHRSIRVASLTEYETEAGWSAGP